MKKPSIPEGLLYDPRFEHDGCGTGFVATLTGKPSHDILERAIECVVNLTHRGAVSADAKTGDGAGVLTQIPKKLFQKEIIRKFGYAISSIEGLGVGMIFLPKDSLVDQEKCRVTVEEIIARYGLKTLGWRRVPVDASALGDKALETQPEIEQVLIERTRKVPKDRYEQTLFLIRKVIEKTIEEQGIEDFYIPSFSSRTIVYKGLLVAPQLKKFYLDLNDPDYETTLALFHQRYSTNTFPNWVLAQPFRMIGHNGEINTIQGNRSWMHAREAELRSEAWTDEIEYLKPIIQAGGSDSAMLDNVLEAIVMSGRDILHTLMMLIPEAWQNTPGMDAEHRAFYQYHECLIEPWDGPAAISFSDGRIVGATLDRNGLRPARYIITKDGLVVMGSEVGMIPLDERQVIEKGRLGPGGMIAIDTVRGKVLRDKTIKDEISKRQPYRSWLQRQLFFLKGEFLEDSGNGPDRIPKEDLLRYQTAFGYTQEELSMMVKPMVEDGKEPVGSMGDDSPLAVLSKKPRLLYTYFKQLFAQVTNPAIDPIREELVMSLNTLLGRRRNLFEESEEHAKLIQIPTPVLRDEELEWLKQIKDPAFQSVEIPCLFDVAKGPEALEAAIEEITRQANQAVDEGKTILVLSDRGVNEERAPIPSLLAVGAVHHHLIREGKRMRAALVVETGDAHEVHHFSCLIGYGADALNPYLAYRTVKDMVASGAVKGLDAEKAFKNFDKAVRFGLLKNASKMGISTISSYRGAQIFEAIGLSRVLVQRCFTGTPSRVGGISFDGIARDILAWHEHAFGGASITTLEEGGYYRYRKEGEPHGINPKVTKAVQQYVETGDWNDYVEYSKIVNGREPIALRDLLVFKQRKPIPIEEVELVESIRKNFCTPGISHGALGRETHETLAIAMNRIGAKSNSGEGGEDPIRYKPRPNGDSANSAIKQIASARFGVTIEYIANSRELEIKIAQGSKPGEGGQLPGKKVSGEIARIRHATPGVTLISPPPHHDIYSIEDLAQLIYDLKQANPQAKVCVKLVAAAGVGTIAAGVAKAHADVIQISGHDGGTGASPLSSIKNAGSPWELGLAEAQQVLVLNDLRGRVILRTDGGMKTGRDVVIAAILGAEEVSFGTIALLTLGCVMVRQCHLNTCPVGVATQDETLRQRFTGTPEKVIRLFNGIAQEVREILAQLGFRSLKEIVGRTDLLEVVKPAGHPKAEALELDTILAQADPHGTKPRYHIQERNDWEGDVPMDDQIIRDAREALAGKTPVELFYTIRNTNRSVGTKLAGEIGKRYGDAGLPEGFIRLYFRGSAGQSFGAFCVNGMRLVLIGEANDYVGKGMCGGEIIVMPAKGVTFAAHENVIMGNTVMYGATAGAMYVAGRAGERFCVRNSGARAVVEGLGDHGCEYMTGGVVVVLGETGRNFGAGMTSGSAYVFDEKGDFPEKYNSELVQIDRVSHVDDIDILKSMIRRHVELTESKRAQEILSHWDQYLPRFWKVAPRAVVPQPISEFAEKRQ